MRCDGMPQDQKEEIAKFYIDNSEELPCKSSVNSNDIQKGVLNKTLYKLHSDFVKTSGKTISLNT